MLAAVVIRDRDGVLAVGADSGDGNSATGEFDDDDDDESPGSEDAWKDAWPR